MTPLEFISKASSWPVGDEPMSALKRPMKILSQNNEWEVLSYYYDEENECMVIDIQKV